MPKLYSMDLRERAMERVATGEPIRMVAAALRISPSCVSKWSGRVQATGSAAPAQIGATSRVPSPVSRPPGSK